MRKEKHEVNHKGNMKREEKLFRRKERAKE